jgi:hypothetical protein
MRPNCPIACSAFSPPRSTMSFPFQKPKVQCSLNDAIAHSIPLYWKWGKPHFTVSSTSGQASCTTSRRCARIGRAKGAALAM